MKKAQVINGVVFNIILVDPNNVPDWCAGWPEVVGMVSIGDQFKDGQFIPQQVLADGGTAE